MPEFSRASSGEAGRSGRVLLAEDNAINQRVGAAMLEHLGFAVDIVADGTEAVKAAIQTHYRAILMDCQIPGLDGYQATGRDPTPGGTIAPHADHCGHRLGHRA